MRSQGDWASEFLDFHQPVLFAPSRQLDRAFAQQVRGQQLAFLGNDLVIDLCATATNEAAGLGVAGGEAGECEQAEGWDAGSQVLRRDRDGGQRDGGFAFLKGAAGGFGGLPGLVGTMGKGGRLGGEDLFGLVDLGAPQ